MFGLRKTSGIYIFLEVTIPFLLSLFVITFVMVADQLVRLIDLIFGKGVDPWDILLLFAAILPSILILMIPISLMIGIILGLGRLSSDSEIIALKAGGFSMMEIYKPIIVLTIACFGLVNLMIFRGLSEGEDYFKKKVYEIARKEATVGIKAHEFIDSFEGMTLYVDKIDENTNAIEKIMIYDSEHFERPMTILAREGKIISNDEQQTITLKLSDGKAMTEGSAPGVFRTIQFQDYELSVSLFGSKGGHSDDLTAISMKKLSKKLYRARNGPVRDQNVINKILVEMHRKFAIGFSCLVLALVAMPFGIFPPRSVRSRGFVVGMAVFLAYYTLDLGGYRWARSGVAQTMLAEKYYGGKFEAVPAWVENIPPAIGSWGPIIIIGLFGAWAMRRVINEKEFGGRAVIGPIVDYAGRLVSRVRGK